ncbi:hypothetical protein R3W88_021358 [Solanum pinnatisectum]|uniref:Uncharacterized protein n=1 Tax=Solanum pinnatisectum TaxID=50273 RepID=A0AAV9LUE4_9SOLN|nr:hypothetical protein R3W88_021358 [Solanum pinnatisectum]
MSPFGLEWKRNVLHRVFQKKVKEERDLSLHNEATKFNESVKAVEQTTKESRRENYKMRDIIKQVV